MILTRTTYSTSSSHFVFFSVSVLVFFTRVLARLTVTGVVSRDEPLFILCLSCNCSPATSSSFRYFVLSTVAFSRIAKVSLPTRKVSQFYSYFVPLFLRNTTRNLESAVVRNRCLHCPPRFRFVASNPSAPFGRGRVVAQHSFVAARSLLSVACIR